MGIEVKGLESVQKSLSHLSALGENPRPLLQTLGEMFRDRIEEAFEKEQSPFGERWAPLKLKTRKYKKGEKILREEGNLADWWDVQPGKNSVTISNNFVRNYGAVHQFGSKKKNIPARPFLPIDESGTIEPRLLKTMEDYLENKLEGFFK